MSREESPLSRNCHDRDFFINFYGKGSLIYPLLSRRLKGLSVGINTSPSRKCNFRCIYCGVDRSEEGSTIEFDIEAAESQLKKVLADIQGSSFGNEKIRAITLSGDGEPTLLKDFEELIKRVIATRDSVGLADAKIVVSSNASGLHRETVKKGLKLMYANNGELWVKLDAGTEAYFKRIANTSVSFDTILSNILAISLEHPIKIQTCFMNVNGEMPGEEEIHAYYNRVNHILTNGGRIQSIQLYNISFTARPPAEVLVAPLTDVQMDQIAQELQKNILLPIEVYR